MKQKIIGRKPEKKILENVTEASESVFLALYGRRRVGKTFLIREYFGNNKNYFELTGQKDSLLSDQLDNFTITFNKAFSFRHPIDAPKSWNIALRLLIEKLEKRKGRKILFFDELPWLASRKSNFLSALDYFWNSWASKRNDIVLVVCGSAASWMINKILNAKGGLHNRITHRIRLLPFSLSETKDYLKSRKINLNIKQILEIYIAFGGIPHYLKQLERGCSAIENINKICFTKDGILFNEFNNLYSALFEFYENHIKIIKALAKKHKGLTRNELLRETGFESGGSFSGILDALEESGFIASYLPFDHKSNDQLFRLADEYSLFYLKWILRAPKSIAKNPNNNYWLLKQNTPSYRAWSGYAFETVCLKHIAQIKKCLGISGIATIESGWFYKPKEKELPGAQIDLIIDRSDNCISLCEIKFSDNEFVINKKYAENLKNKIETFKKQTKTKKTVFVIMITTNGVFENKYYDELIDKQIIATEMFDA